MEENKEVLEALGTKKKETRKEKPKFVYGFTTTHGLLLDLDNTTLAETRKIAKKYMERFKLQGYMILRSSENNYHVVFNRYLSWKKVLNYLFKIVWYYHYHQHGIKPSLTYWAILQACKESETLRISRKENKAKPRIIETKGKNDKLIRDYKNFMREMS
jgi:hypothetical protein